MTIYLVLYDAIAGYGIEIFLKGAYSSLKKAEEECKKIYGGWVREVKIDHDYDVCPFGEGGHCAEAIMFNDPMPENIPKNADFMYIGGYEE
ncbi:MAG: hypothetical protein IKF29_00470 [Oceanobacillus sp.]|nr:hypothetical protein [Oceanobacillus sp.]